MSETETVAFRPAKPFRMPWLDIVVWSAAALGALVALGGVAVLAGVLPESIATLEMSRGVDLLAVGFLIAVGPAGFRHWASRRRLLRLDDRLPDFLTDLAALHKAGLTLPDSLVTASKGDYGPLTPEVRMAADQVRWNIPVLVALDNLKKRLSTPIADRALAVVLEAGRTGGNLPEVMEISAANARSFVQLRQNRGRQMALYTIIIYVASLVFIGVCLALHFIFVPKMTMAFGQGAGAGLGLAGQLPTVDEFRAMFYTTALVQAVGNGLVGGLMAEGRSLSGLRHAWFLVALTALGFALA